MSKMSYFAYVIQTVNMKVKMISVIRCMLKRLSGQGWNVFPCDHTLGVRALIRP